MEEADSDADSPLVNVLGSLTREESTAVVDELHEFIVEAKCKEAVAITNLGMDAQIEYLKSRFDADAIVDRILDAVELAARSARHTF